MEHKNWDINGTLEGRGRNPGSGYLRKFGTRRGLPLSDVAPT